MVSFQTQLSVAPAPSVACGPTNADYFDGPALAGLSPFSQEGTGVGYGCAHSSLLGMIGGAVAGWSQPPPYPWVG